MPPLPPLAGGTETAVLLGILDQNRDVMAWKLDGLTEEQARWSPVPSGTSLLGITKHLAWVEYGWFQLPFGRPVPADETTEIDGFGFAPLPGDTIESVLALYAAARAASDRTVVELPLDTVGETDDGRVVDLRWVLAHMIEETARHAGHADLLRELLDDTTGYRPPRD